MIHNESVFVVSETHGRRWWRAGLAVVAIEPVTFVFMAGQPIEPLVDHPATRKRKREGSREKSRYISCLKPDGRRMSESKPKPDLFDAFEPFFFFNHPKSVARRLPSCDTLYAPAHTDFRLIIFCSKPSGH